MSDPHPPPVPAGWYPDGTGGLRWWDGRQWTEHTQHPVPGRPPSAPPPGWTPAAPRRGRRMLPVLLGGGLAALLVAALAVVIVVMARGGDPEDIAEDYLAAGFGSDYGTVCELTAKEPRQALLDDADAGDCDEYADAQREAEDEQSQEYEEKYGLSIADIRGNFDVEVEVDDVDEQGDGEAIVEIERTTEYTEDDDFLAEELDGERSSSQAFTMRLVEEDGDWKVEEPYVVD